jgi:hypothetical protein
MDLVSGTKPIEQVRDAETFGPACDRVWSRNEFDPGAPVIARRVLRKFVRVSPVLKLSLAGREIGTTREHPFYVEGKGWTPASDIRAGDRILLKSGEWLRVDAAADSGRVETVYNLEVEDDHTYFVGAHDWGFAVWAHNTVYSDAAALRAQIADLLEQPGMREVRPTPGTQEHHPFFRMFRDALDRSGRFNVRTITGRMHPQDLQELDLLEHEALHQDWNDFVVREKLDRSLLVEFGGRKDLRIALERGKVQPHEIFQHLEQFYTDTRRITALRSLRRYARRIGIE